MLFRSGTVRLNLAVFGTILEGAQFSSILTTTASPGTNTLILNASEDFKVNGYEMEATWQITDEFLIQAIAGVQDAKGDGDVHTCLVRPFPGNGGFGCNPAQNPALFAPGAGPLPTVKTEGGQGFAAPDYNWALVFAYSAPVMGHDLAASVIIRATDDVFLSTKNDGTPNFEKGYTLVDMHLSYTFELADGSSVVAALTGKNVLDEEYVEQELALGNGGFRGWGPPRQLALELRWDH